MVFLQNIFTFLNYFSEALLNLIKTIHNILSILFAKEVLSEKCPNMEFFLVLIQSECGKMRTRKNPCLDNFHAVIKLLKKQCLIIYEVSFFGVPNRKILHLYKIIIWNKFESAGLLQFAVILSLQTITKRKLETW